MNHTSQIEWIRCGVGLIRIWGPGFSYGDPYCWCATVTKDDETLHISGVLRAPNSKERKAIQEAAIKDGFSWIAWERMKNGEVKEFKIKINKV